jgi:hypothetical protein
MTIATQFEEKQYLPVWSNVLMIGCTLITLYLLDKHFTSADPSDETKGFVLISTFLMMLLVTVVIIFARLKTFISEQGISYQFYPFHHKPKHIHWREIRFCFIRRYLPILEFGGWGFRISIFGKGKAINTKGCDGLQLVFHNGKRLLIGTPQMPDALIKTLAENDWYKPEIQQL